MWDMAVLSRVPGPGADAPAFRTQLLVFCQVRHGKPVAVQRTYMPERRKFERRAFDLPVSVSTDTRKDRAGMAHDLSPSGLSFRSRSRYALGEVVVLMFRMPTNVLKFTTGRVVRAVVQDGANLFPHFTAVQFDAPDLELASC